MKQGCILSPLLFNLYSETIFREALQGVQRGIKINGVIVNNLRYADDCVVLADNLADLQDLMNRIVSHSERHGLFTNASKTKLLVFSKTNIVANLSINNIQIEQVNSFRYLGTIINNQCDPKIEIKARIEQARKTFIDMKQFFTISELSLECA